MMIKVFLLVFTALTATAGYLTIYEVGVIDASVIKHSVRQGSVRRGPSGLFIGGYRRGK